MIVQFESSFQNYQDNKRLTYVVFVGDYDGDISGWVADKKRSRNRDSSPAKAMEVETAEVRIHCTHEFRASRCCACVCIRWRHSRIFTLR